MPSNSLAHVDREVPTNKHWELSICGHEEGAGGGSRTSSLRFELRRTARTLFQDHSGGAVAAHNEAAAERIVRWLGGRTGMPVAVADLALTKNDPGKVTCAALVRRRTAVPNEWLAARLAMGHASYVSALVNRTLRDAKARRVVERLEREFGVIPLPGEGGGE